MNTCLYTIKIPRLPDQVQIEISAFVEIEVGEQTDVIHHPRDVSREQLDSNASAQRIKHNSERTITGIR